MREPSLDEFIEDLHADFNRVGHDLWYHYGDVDEEQVDVPLAVLFEHWLNDFTDPWKRLV